MRHHLPGKGIRRTVRERLLQFYQNYQEYDIDEAVRLLSKFYELAEPEIVFYSQIDRGKTIGLTESDGKISILHPSDFAQLKATDTFKPTAALWIRTLLHEFSHYVSFVNDEDKAEEYARKFVTGLG